MTYRVAYEGAGGVETLAGEFRCMNRADFEAFTDRLFTEAESLWPSAGNASAEPAKAAEPSAAPNAAAPPPRPSPAAAGEGEARAVVACVVEKSVALAGLPPLTFDAALHALRGPERRAKMLEVKERGYTARQVATAFGSTQGAVEMAISTARRERAGASS